MHDGRTLTDLPLLSEAREQADEAEMRGDTPKPNHTTTHSRGPPPPPPPRRRTPAAPPESSSATPTPAPPTRPPLRPAPPPPDSASRALSPPPPPIVTHTSLPPPPPHLLSPVPLHPSPLTTLLPSTPPANIADLPTSPVRPPSPLPVLPPEPEPAAIAVVAAASAASTSTSPPKRRPEPLVLASGSSGGSGSASAAASSGSEAGSLHGIPYPSQEMFLDSENLSVLEKIFLFANSPATYHRLFIARTLPEWLPSVDPHEAVLYILPLLNGLGTDHEESVRETFAPSLARVMWYFFTRCALTETDPEGEEYTTPPETHSGSDDGAEHHPHDEEGNPIIPVSSFTPLLGSLLLSVNRVVGEAARWGVVQVLGRLKAEEDTESPPPDPPAPAKKLLPREKEEKKWEGWVQGSVGREKRDMIRRELILGVVLGMARLEEDEEEYERAEREAAGMLDGSEGEREGGKRESVRGEEEEEDGYDREEMRGLEGAAIVERSMQVDQHDEGRTSTMDVDSDDRSTTTDDGQSDTPPAAVERPFDPDLDVRLWEPDADAFLSTQEELGLPPVSEQEAEDPFASDVDALPSPSDTPDEEDEDLRAGDLSLREDEEHPGDLSLEDITPLHLLSHVEGGTTRLLVPIWLSRTSEVEVDVTPTLRGEDVLGVSVGKDEQADASHDPDPTILQPSPEHHPDLSIALPPPPSESDSATTDPSPGMSLDVSPSPPADEVPAPSVTEVDPFSEVGKTEEIEEEETDLGMSTPEELGLVNGEVRVQMMDQFVQTQEEPEGEEEEEEDMDVDEEDSQPTAGPAQSLPPPSPRPDFNPDYFPSPPINFPPPQQPVTPTLSPPEWFPVPPSPDEAGAIAGSQSSSRSSPLALIASLALMSAIASSGVLPPPDLEMHFLPELLRIASQADEWVRREAGFVIGALAKAVSSELVERDLVPLLVQFSNDPFWHVRHSSLFSAPPILARLKPEERRELALRIFLPAFVDPAKAVRSACLELLGEAIVTFKDDPLGPPEELVRLFLGDPSEWQEDVDDEYDSPLEWYGTPGLGLRPGRTRSRRDPDRCLVCAFNFPAVALTLGRERWPELRDYYLYLARDRSAKVRRTLASSVGALAEIIGEEAARRDLLGVWKSAFNPTGPDGYVDEEVVSWAIESVDGMLRAIDGDMGKEVVEGLLDWWNGIMARRWRLREHVAVKLAVIAQGWGKSDGVAHGVRVILARALTDDVAAVRESAAEGVSGICAAFEDGPEIDAVRQDLLELAENSSFRCRMTFMACMQSLLADGMKDQLEYLWPKVWQLGRDPVVDVRISVARLIAAACGMDTFFRDPTSRPGPLAGLIRKLSHDQSYQVRSFVSCLRGTHTVTPVTTPVRGASLMSPSAKFSRPPFLLPGSGTPGPEIDDEEVDMDVDATHEFKSAIERRDSPLPVFTLPMSPPAPRRTETVSIGSSISDPMDDEAEDPFADFVSQQQSEPSTSSIDSEEES